jgi:hypothetical protein
MTALAKTINNLTDQPTEESWEAEELQCCKLLLSKAEYGCEICVSQRGQKSLKTVAENLRKFKPLPDNR